LAGDCHSGLQQGGTCRPAEFLERRLGRQAACIVLERAARALANVPTQRVFDLQLRLAQRPALTGVIGALGAFGKTEAIPALIDARRSRFHTSARWS
jgi:hypothetical protein